MIHSKIKLEGISTVLATGKGFFYLLLEYIIIIIKMLQSLSLRFLFSAVLADTFLRRTLEKDGSSSDIFYSLKEKNVIQRHLNVAF